MARKLLGVVGILLVVGLAILAVGGGGVPALFQGQESADDAFPTESAPSTAEADGTSGESTTTSERPFTFIVDDIEACGETCRDVTLTLRNEQETTASNVTVYTRIFAGNGTDGDVIWTGEESIGSLGAGGSTTMTERVELGLTEAYAVQQADGWITIQTTVQSDSETMTLTEQRNVT